MSTITWVEDKPRYVQDMAGELELLGHSVHFIEDANSLLSQLPQLASGTHLVILDLWLPVGQGEGVPPGLRGKDRNTERGLWLYQKVKEALLKAGRNVPIVVLSGNLDVDTQKESLAQGIEKNRMFKKPVEFDTFVSMAHELAKKSSK